MSRSRAASAGAAGQADLGDIERDRGPGREYRSQGDVADRLVAESAVDQVFADQHLAALGLEGVDIDVPRPHARPVVVEIDAADIDENPPSLTGRDKTDHSRRVTAASGHHDDVLQPTDGGTVGIQQRQAHDAKRVYEVAGHGT
jgi:hypothetical protein